jgi:hypothetical protein
METQNNIRTSSPIDLELFHKITHKIEKEIIDVYVSL